MRLNAVIMAFAAFSLAATSPSSAKGTQRGDSTIIEAATRYLDAYQSLDLDRLESLYVEGAAFDDPTSLHVQGIGGPFVWRGRTNILAGIRSWIVGGVTALEYEIEDTYEASGRVVFIGAINSFVAAPNGIARYRYRIVTIVTIENGLVSEHRDYTDYAGAVQVAIATQ